MISQKIDVYDLLKATNDDVSTEVLNKISNSYMTMEDVKANKLIYSLLMTSTSLFAQTILRGPLDAPYNGKFLIGDHHLEWDRALAKNDRNCFLCARDHGKSYFFSFAYPIQQAIKYPGELGYIFSGTQDQASLFLEIIKDELESNRKLRYLVPNKKNRWGSKYIKLANGHRIRARGYGTRVRSGHPRWMVVDDVLNDETAYSAKVRLKQNDYFFNALSNMIIPGGQINVVGTPFHLMDLYGELKNNTEYYYKEFPAEIDGRPLWSIRYSIDSLHRKEREIGTIRYGREYLVSPISDNMSIFPMFLFKGHPVEQFNYILGLGQNYWKDQNIDIYIGVDFAISASAQADYTVVITLGLDSLGNRWIIDIFREKGLSYQEQKSYLINTGIKYGDSLQLMLLESNQMQAIFGNELIIETDLPIKNFTTTAAKHSLENGIPALRLLFENKKFRFPRGDLHSIEMTDILISELHSMTFLEGAVTSIMDHDDMVMALWLANNAVKLGGFNFYFDTKLLPDRLHSYIDLKHLGRPSGNSNSEKILDKDYVDNKSSKNWKSIILGDLTNGKGISYLVDGSNYLGIRDILLEIISDSEGFLNIIANSELKYLESIYIEK